MSDKERDLAAAEAALGVRDDLREEEPGDEELMAAVARWEVRLGDLARAVPPVPPPPGLLDAVLAEIRGTAPPSPGTLTVRSGEGTWREMAPGVTMKPLSHDRASGRQTMLVRLAPGATFRPHGHELDEECLVLEGELRFGDLILRAGDFHLARKGHHHPLASSPSGCLLYISGAL